MTIVAFLGYGAYVVVTLLLTAVATTTLVWMLHAWRRPEALDQTAFAVDLNDLASPRYSFSLIVPARHEQRVLGHTLAHLAAGVHPRFEIIVVVGADDCVTRDVAREAERGLSGRVRVVLDHSWPKNKPKALNTALPHCRGEIVGIFDAEDIVHPQLLASVDHAFQAAGADVVQGGTQLMNFRSSWYSLRNVLEYYFWFRSRLHFHAATRFIPLGGNTVFVRREWLEAVGGWDAECLAEDCDLGARLSVRGARTTVAYDPRLATREETPVSLRALVRQRTRWNQGYLQVLRKGDWRRLPPKRRALALYTLASPFFQALAGGLLPLSLVTVAVLTLPVGFALVSFIPLIPLLTILVIEAVGLADFCREYGFRLSLRDLLRLFLGAIPYQIALGYAALRAIIREAGGITNWEKTRHVGAHL